MNKKTISPPTADELLDILNNQIVESNQFKDAIIYIDEFVGFTTQEYQIIAKLLQIAKQVNITICTDNLMQNENFVITDEMKQKITELFFNPDFINSINGSPNDKSKILSRISIVKGVLQ